tara:strand:- start:60 stop:206 length:147 start_codon:yes stop_codon:yes gene_type:complete
MIKRNNMDIKTIIFSLRAKIGKTENKIDKVNNKLDYLLEKLEQFNKQK